jgi:hypothetical protein
MTPAERRIVELEWDGKRAPGEPTMREELMDRMSGGSRIDAMLLLDEGKPRKATAPLGDPAREATISGMVSEVHKALNRQADGATGEDVVKAMSKLRTADEVDRFLDLAEQQYGKRMSREQLEMQMADRLGDKDFGMASNYLEGSVHGATAELSTRLGMTDVTEAAGQERERMDAESRVAMANGLINTKKVIGTRAARCLAAWMPRRP